VKTTLAAAFLVAALAAGCGSRSSAPATTSTAAPTTTRAHAPMKLVRDYRKLYGDVHAMRAAAAKTTKSTIQGTPELQATTNAFLDDLDRSALTLKEKNRMIDHAAAAVAGNCGQCFQMLEAVRPIPALAGH
jgi:hypothetical protein